MSRGADSRALSGPGILFLRHDNFIQAGGSVDQRDCLLAVTVDGERSEYGHHHVGDSPSGKGHSVGDLNGAFHWPRNGNKRPMGAAMFAAAATIVDASAAGDKFGSGEIGARPVRKSWDDSDDRFATLLAKLPKLTNEPPAGSAAIALAGMEENEQCVLVFSPQTQAALVAPWRGGKYENGSIVFDLNDKGELDPLKNGRIQHLMRVTHAQGAWQPAINMSSTAKKSPGGGGLLWGRGDGSAPAGRGVAHWLSAEMGGPIHAGHSTKDRHRAGTNAEGEPEQPGHVWIEALFYEDVIRDGPKEHGPDYPEDEPTDWPHLTHVYEGFDKKRGKWRRWTTVPLSRPVPPVPVPRLPPPPDNPVPVPQFVPKGQLGGGGGMPGEGRGEPTNPTTEHPANPAMMEYELGVGSLILLGQRDKNTMGGDGRYGQGGGDVAEKTPPQPSQGITVGLPTRPVDFSNPAIPIPPGFFDNGGESTAPAAPGDIGGPGETFSGPINGAFGDRTRNQGVLGKKPKISKEGAARGGPKPLAVHLQARVKVNVGADGNGQWDYKSLPGARWVNGTAAKAQLSLGAGGLLLDGVDDQSEWLGDLDVLLDQGSHGGNPARFGWGDWDATTGEWSDGAVFSLTGASNAWNLRLDFRNASGAARAGTTSHYGHWTPGTDDTYDLGTSSVAWRRLYLGNGSAGSPSLAFDDTDTGIYSGGANQINFATNGALAARINASALGPAASATTLGALSDPWTYIYGTGATISTTFIMPTMTSDPGSPSTGQMWLRTDL